MNKLHVSIMIITILLASAFSAHADHFRGRVWFYGPGWGPRWHGHSYIYPFPYYVEQPVIIQQPEVYLQTVPQPQAPQANPNNYWYYCQNPQGYYPYVKACPDGWMKVVPFAPQPQDLNK